MKFVFRADGSEEMGMGHLNRCQIVSEELSRQGHDVILITRKTEGALRFLDSPAVLFFEEPETIDDFPEADMCVVDLYCYEDGYYERLSAKYPQIGMFDDFRFHVPRAVQCVINTNIYANDCDYREEITKLVGIKYFPLRPDTRKTERTDCSGRILICMGGGDPEGQTQRMLELLLEVTKLPIDVIYGPTAYPLFHKTEKQQNELVATLFSPPNFAQMLGSARYCVIGAGGLLYEAVFSGVPSICLSLAENQKKVAKSFAMLGATLYAGYYAETSNLMLLDLLRKIDSDDIFRNEIAKSTQGLIDGKGAERLARGLVECCCRGRV